jgi:hypothetical protein
MSYENNNNTISAHDFIFLLTLPLAAALGDKEKVKELSKQQRRLGGASAAAPARPQAVEEENKKKKKIKGECH